MIRKILPVTLLLFLFAIVAGCGGQSIDEPHPAESDSGVVLED